MNVAILSESPADEEALRILVDRVMGRPTEPVATPPLRSRGWPSVKDVLPTVIRHLHYRTEAYGLVCVADANHSDPHSSGHEEPGSEAKDCRLCTLREVVWATFGDVGAVAGRAPLKVAVGVACPAIEAWYLCGSPQQVTERDWEEGMGAKQWADNRRELKRHVYGAERFALAHEIACATSKARDVARDIAALESIFPIGFGSLAMELRTW